MIISLYRSTLAGLTTTVVLISPVVFADPVVSHVGMADPVSQGWLHNICCAQGPGSETTATGVHDYWRVQDSTTSGGNNYFSDPGASAFTGDWSFEASIRNIDSPVLKGADVGVTAVIVADGLNYWSFYIDNDKAGPLAPGYPASLIVPVEFDTRDDYHIYSIEFSQNGPGATDDTADFFIDGQLIASGLGRASLFSSNLRFVVFGSAATLGVMDAHFEYVRFDGNLAVDDDGDGLDNDVDNCPLQFNPLQRDTDADGFGNWCDPDLNNDNVVNAADLGILKSVFFTADPDADFDGNGVVNVADLGVMKSLFFQSPGR